MTIDRLQHRYGWTDEQILRLPYARFRQLAQVAAEQEAKEQRRLMQTLAVHAYLVNPPMDGDRPWPLRRYLRELGLDDPEPPMTEDERRKAVERAIAIAERARQAMAAGLYRRVTPEEVSARG